MKKYIKFVLFFILLLGAVTSYSTDTKCTKCTTSSIQSENTGKCYGKVNGLGDTCTTAACGWMNPCNCDGEVEVECDETENPSS